MCDKVSYFFFLSLAAVTAGLLAPNYYTVPTTSDLLSLSSGNTAQPCEFVLVMMILIVN